MNTGRRNFIKTTGTGLLGFGILPVIEPLSLVDLPSYAARLPRVSPESQGVSSAAIRNFLKATEGAGFDWHSFMMLKHGKVVAEGCWKPFGPTYKHTLYSLSKSFTSTAIGLLVKEGKLSIADPVISFFPDHLPENPSDNLKKMKVSHLLTMNTGHDADTTPKLRESNAHWTTTFLAQPVVHEPGTHFLYNTGATYILGAILHKLTGQKLDEYLEPRLFGPLGIKGYDWELTPQGLNTAGYGLRVKTEDIAKFGQLYLQKGQWEGKQILTESWIEEATKKQTTSNPGNSDWSQGYGYQFWRCKPGFYRGDGAFGQLCVVMPEQDAVLAVTCESWDMQKEMNIIWENLLPGLQNGTVSGNGNGEYAALKKELNNLQLRVPKGKTTSATSNKINNKTYKLTENTYGAELLSFTLTDKNGTFRIRTGEGESRYVFGWEKWITNPESKIYTFRPGGTGSLVPSKAAGTATWINENTLQINLRFVEAIHGDKISCHFEGDKVKMSFLNSVAENSKNAVERRLPVEGVSI